MSSGHDPTTNQAHPRGTSGRPTFRASPKRELRFVTWIKEEEFLDKTGPSSLRDNLQRTGTVGYHEECGSTAFHPQVRLTPS